MKKCYDKKDIKKVYVTRNANNLRVEGLSANLAHNYLVISQLWLS
jgi:hypothetical protein